MATGAEVVSAANGVAGLFNAAVVWFDYVYVAKNMWPRLQSLYLQLDNAQLRLTRWGEAAGLSGLGIDDESPESTYDSMMDKDQEAAAAKTFAVMSARFAECQKICHGFRGGKKEDDAAVKDVETPPSRANWSPMNKYLHDTMRKIVEGRKNKISVLRKAKFAIYDEKHLRDLVKDINDHIDSLYKIFPLSSDTQSLDKQGEQTKAEMDQLLQVLKTLGTAIKDRDELLGSAIGSVLNQQNNMTWTFNNDQAMINQQGQMNGGRAEQHNTVK